MILKPSTTFNGTFNFNTFAGGETNATSVTGALWRNGAVDGAVVVTVTNPDTGQYKLTGTLGAYTAGDEVSLVATATYGGITYNDVVWDASIDTALPSDVETDTQDIQSRLPAALVGGRIDASVGAMAANVLTAAAIATDAIDADALAADAVAEIAAGISIPSAASIADAVWDEAIAGHVGAGSTGATLNAVSAAAIADAVWDEAIAGHLGAGSTGATLNSASAPSAADVADAVWDELLAGHAIAGSAGAQLTAAGAAGDPWATLLPGSYAANTAGYIIGTNLDTKLSNCCPDSGCTSATCDCSGPLGTYTL